MTPNTTNPPPEYWMAYVTNRWSRTIAQPLLITVMFTAFITGPLTILQILIPNTPWRPFSFVFFFLILETVYTTLWLQQPNQRTLNHVAYRSAEFLVFIILVRLLTWTFAGNWPTLDLWQTFLFEPITFLEDGFFLAMMLATFFIWQMTIQLTNLFGELAIDQAEAAYYADVFGDHKLDARPNITDRSKLIAAFLQQWLFGGLILVVCASFSTFDLANPALNWSFFRIGRLPLPLPMLLSLVFYFIAGFLLLSQGRLALMNARWLINRVEKNDRLERSWYRFSLWLLAIVAFVAALLPLGSTTALSQIVGAIVAGITAVVTFIIALFLGLVSLLLSRSSPDEAIVPTQPVEPLVLPTPAPVTPSEAAETMRMITSSAFWAVVIVLSVIAVLFFLRERHIVLNGSNWRRWWTAVTTWWRTLWQNVSQQIDTTRQTLQARRQRADKKPITLPKPRFIRLNALSPREQLRYFYLSTVERAGQRGVSRQESETPLEFARDLKENWPDAETDVETLTDAFLRARYSPQPIEAQQVNPIKEHWKRLRARLRRR